MNKYNLTEEEVIKIIESPFIFIRNKVKTLDMTNVETREEFEKQAKNFNIPFIGKLYANYYNFQRIKQNGLRKSRKKDSKGEENQ